MYKKAVSRKDILEERVSQHFVVITWVCYPLNKIHLVNYLCPLFMESSSPEELVCKLLLTLSTGTCYFVQLDPLVGQTDIHEEIKSHNFEFLSPISL